jgi:LytS/YehU family sensor histidine kinase
MRLTHNLVVCAVAYVLFVGVALFLFHKRDCFGSLVLFQFIVACILPTFLGYISQLYSIQQAKQQEIDRLKTENLQSRCDALSNQLNPHFFFNSLNGLTSLIRNKDEERALTYINKMSDIFRYVLQSDKRGIRELREELEFVQSFSYLMEIRFADKLVFDTDVPEKSLSLLLPTLSILPLIDNVVVHNTIDSSHKMVVRISLNTNNELAVTNPLYPKLTPPDTNGTGLKNLENRFALLMGKHIRVENDGKTHTVYLPLTDEHDERINSGR